eukprot:g31009.t1
MFCQLLLSYGYDSMTILDCPQDLRWISHHVNKPKWTFPKEDARAQKLSNERHALEDKVSSPPEVGPGKYIYPPGFHTQFPYEVGKRVHERLLSDQFESG